KAIETNNKTLKEQSDKIASFSKATLEKNSSDFIALGKKILINSETKRISDLTKNLTLQFQLYLSELDYVNMNQAVKDLMNDSNIRYAAVYKNSDKKIFEAYNLGTGEGKNNETNFKIINAKGHYEFIKESFLNHSVKLRECVVNGEFIIESAQSIKAGNKILGLINIGFSIQKMYSDIMENSKKISSDMESLISSFKKNAYNQNELIMKQSGEQLKINLNSQSEIIDDEIRRTKNKLIDSLSEVQKKQSKILTKKIAVIITLLGVLFLIIGIWFAVILAKKFSKPVKQFVERANKLGKGDFDERLNIKSGDEFEILADSFNAMSDEIKESRNALAEWNKSLEKSVREKTASIKNLLDNAGQGFLSFGNSLAVDKDYSIECVKIFGKEIENCRFPDLIYPDDTENNSVTEKIFGKIFGRKNDKQLDLYLPLLPYEITINGSIISIEYKLFVAYCELETGAQTEKVMAVLTDITERRNLEMQIERERTVLKMVVKTVVHYEDFVEILKDYSLFYEEKIYVILDGKYSVAEIVDEIYRETHTFKGLFAQFEMSESAMKIHLFEDKLSKIKNNIEKYDLVKLKNEIDEIRDIKKWIEKDLTVLAEILGADFFTDKNYIKIHKNKIIEIENKIVSTCSAAECGLFLPEIRKLRLKSLSECLKIYADTVERISEQYGKSVNPLVIEADNIFIDAEKYAGFIKSLIHIFRNSITHGIESPEERYGSNKPEYGTIICSAVKKDDNLVIKISDDGRGLDANKIGKKAVELGIILPEQLLKMSQSELLNIIFYNGFSSLSRATEIAGRGVGLSSVKSELEKIGGSVKINSVKMEFSEFEFIIPETLSFEIPAVDPEKFLNPLAENTVKYFKEQIGVDLTIEKIEYDKNQNLPLYKISVYTGIKGILSGSLFLSADGELAEYILKKMMIEKLSPAEEKILIDKGLAESLNVIAGAAIKHIENFENLITIDSPVSVIGGDENILKFTDGKIFNCFFKARKGRLSLNTVLRNI
nr:HAMP domain-containing protein [bacterium]